MKYIQPFSDLLNYDNGPDQFGISDQIGRHRMLAFRMKRYLGNSNHDLDDRLRFDDALREFVGLNPYNARILLYLPFALYAEPTLALRNIVKQNWRTLLDYKDARGNFDRGADHTPLSTIPDPCDFGDGLSRVVKIAHLLPWLVHYSYLRMADVLDTIKSRQDDLILQYSVLDTLPVFDDFDPLSVDDREALKNLGDYLPTRGVRIPSPPPQDNTKLRDPLCPRMETFRGLELPETESEEILRYGGPILQGYLRKTNNLEVWPLSYNAPAEAAPHNIHRYFNTVWGGESLAMLRDVQFKHALQYMRLPCWSHLRRLCLECLEQDVLQSRLMHEGFPGAYADLSPDTYRYDTIEGASAFYDDRYRTVASQLFVTYVFLPQL